MSHKDSLAPSQVLPLLKTKEFGRSYFYLPETVSTNLLAGEQARKGAPHGCLVVAETQSGGRGRRGRSWVSPSGGIWMSLVLRPRMEPSRAPLQTVLAAVALREALEGEGIKGSIKWPNDILCSGRKVSGILTEIQTGEEGIRHLVVGLGINANFSGRQLPEDLQSRSGTLLDLLGRPLDRSQFLAGFLRIWEAYYRRSTQAGYHEVLQEWRRDNCTLGRRVHLDTGTRRVTGRAVDIHQEGGLLVEEASGRRELFLAGEVTLLGE